jgi:intracellular sulfur oxidation DsrE/DsrF family protein
MQRKMITIIIGLVLSVCLLLVAAHNVSAEGYKVLKGMKSVKVVFDVRGASPKGVVAQLGLIQKMFKDKGIRDITDDVDFVVVFSGPVVKLISTQTDKFSAQEKEDLKIISNTVSEMAKAGVKMEVCSLALTGHGVDPASILPEIKHVPNGWVSLIGYQAKGYELVPVY